MGCSRTSAIGGKGLSNINLNIIQLMFTKALQDQEDLTDIEAIIISTVECLLGLTRGSKGLQFSFYSQKSLLRLTRAYWGLL